EARGAAPVGAGLWGGPISPMRPFRHSRPFQTRQVPFHIAAAPASVAATAATTAVTAGRQRRARSRKTPKMAGGSLIAPGHPAPPPPRRAILRTGPRRASHITTGTMDVISPQEK